MKKKIFIIVGEESGDLLCSKVFSKINLENYEIYGILGNELEKFNRIKKIFHCKEISFMGIKDVIINIFKIKKLLNYTVSEIQNIKPDLIFSVDAPDFVFRVINSLKIKNFKAKFYHFVAPTIWAWRESRAKKIKSLLDKIFLLFDFEKKFFDKYEINSDFVGHPFFDDFDLAPNNNLENKNIITLCSGSRISELKIFLPLFKSLIKKLDKKYLFHFPVTKIHESYIKNELKDLTNIVICSDKEEKDKYFKKTRFAIAKSGTISLDLCKYKIPFITIYKFSWFNYFLIKPLVKVKNINIVNIMSQKTIIPELIQGDCNLKNILKLTNKYLSSTDECFKMIDEYSHVLSRISSMDSAQLVANEIELALK